MKIRVRRSHRGRHAHVRERRTPLPRVAALIATVTLVAVGAATTTRLAPGAERVGPGSIEAHGASPVSQVTSPLTEPTAFRPLPASVVLASTTLAGASSVTLTVPQAPVGARAALLNVTTSHSSESTRISACAGAAVTTSCAGSTSLMARPDASGSSLVIAPLGGPDGNQTTLFNALGDVTMTADLTGYFIASADAHAPLDSLLAPITASAAVSELDLRPGTTSVVDLPDVPPGATAAVVDLAATGASSTTSLSMCPVGAEVSSCTGTTALTTDGPQPARNLVVVPLDAISTSQIAIRSSGAAVRTSVTVQGYFIRSGTPAAAGRLYPTDGPDILSWTGISADHDITLSLPDLPPGTLAVSLRVTGTSADGPTALSVCPGSTSSIACMKDDVVAVAPLDIAASNYTLVHLDPRDPTHVTVRATGSAVTARVEMRGYVAPDSASSGSSGGGATASGAAPSVTSPTPTATAPASADPPAAAAGSDPTPSTTTASTPASAGRGTPSAAASPGEVRPSGGSTGVPVGTVLRAYHGDLVITTPGTVIDSLDIFGFVTIKAADVTIRNSRVRGSGPGSTNTGLINCTSAAVKNAVIEDVTLAPDYPSVWLDGVLGHDFTAVRVNAYDVVDGFGVFNTTGPAANVTIASSYVHDLSYFSSDPNHSDNRTHNDAIQIQGGSNIQVVGNYLEAYLSTSVGTQDYLYPQAGFGVIVTPNVGPVTGARIDKNWITGSYIPIKLTTGTWGATTFGEVNDNRFAHDMRNVPMNGVNQWFTILMTPDMTATTTGNVYDDTNTPVTVRHDSGTTTAP